MPNGTKVRRIKAATEAEIITDPVLNAVKPAKKVKKVSKKAPGKAKKAHKFIAPSWLKAVGKPFLIVFGPIGRYVKGSWQELRLTKWPNRRATWGLTLAVILFSVFFAALILAADFGFETLMKQVILR
jgi:preprotein translocase SecE subunit